MNTTPLPSAPQEIADTIQFGHARWAQLKESIGCVPNSLMTAVDVAVWGSFPARTEMEQQAAAFLTRIWSHECPTQFVVEGCQIQLPPVDLVAVAARGDHNLRSIVAAWFAHPFWA